MDASAEWTARLAGVGLYLAAVGVFASMDATTKVLVVGLPPTEVMWARFGFHLLLMATALRVLGGVGAPRAPWRPRALRVQVIRSLALAACNLLYALALQRVPLAECTAINFVGPVLTVALPRRGWASRSAGGAGRDCSPGWAG